jgi:hypothetical protein
MDQATTRKSIADYQAAIGKISEENSRLLDELGDAGVATRGYYQNKINLNLKNLAFFEGQIEKLEATLNGKNPEQQKLFIYVISSTKEKIESHLGEELKKHLPPLTHSPDGCCSWHPYEIKPLSIQQLINSIRDKYGFGERMVDYYIDGRQDAKTRMAFDDNRSFSIVIVDLLSIHEENLENVVLFNTRNVHALIFPFPRQMHSSLQKFMEGQRTRHFDIPEYVAEGTEQANFYRPAVSEQRDLTNILFQIIVKKLSIRNEISDMQSADDLLRSRSVQRVITTKL